MNELIICPAYNEQVEMQNTIDSILKYYNGQIVIVDDGSTDNTINCISNDLRINVINHKKRRGYGAAIKSGFKYAINEGFKKILTFDSDGQHDACFIRQMFDELEQNDFVNGTRFSNFSRKDSDIPKKRLEANLFFNFIIQKILNLNISDVFSGMKAYNVKLIKNFQLKENGYGFPIEVLFNLKVSRAKIIEVPINLTYLDQEKNFNNDFKDDIELMNYLINLISTNINEFKDGLNSNISTNLKEIINIGFSYCQTEEIFKTKPYLKIFNNSKLF